MGAGLYDYMVKGKTETFSLDWAKYCLTHGHWKKINNKRLMSLLYKIFKQLEIISCKAVSHEYALRKPC